MPLNASLSTQPITSLVGNCPEKRLSCEASRLPLGMVKVLQMTLRIGNFTFPRSRAFACARNTEGLSFTFLTYSLHSRIRTLYVAPRTFDIKQNESLFLARRTLILMSLGRKRS